MTIEAMAGTAAERFITNQLAMIFPYRRAAWKDKNPTEAATPKNVLADFRGVMVTDFYSAYESIDCRQQKCLIHLIRDLNDDLRRNPFNAEIQEVGTSFATLLRPMIETIDQYGLKRRYLRKQILYNLRRPNLLWSRNVSQNYIYLVRSGLSRP